MDEDLVAGRGEAVANLGVLRRFVDVAVDEVVDDLDFVLNTEVTCRSRP